MKKEEIAALSNLHLIKLLESTCFEVCDKPTKKAFEELKKIEIECGKRLGFDPNELNN